jgi:demethylmenaquinone methyltransferase / 2-methoxy-6-polyprenyl-1,4-benzoquinol methylase
MLFSLKAALIKYMKDQKSMPYRNMNESKKEQVRYMFNNIATRYDFLNHFLSFGADRYWRKKAIGELSSWHPKSIIDIATGTGDFALAALKCKPERIAGVDISEEMIDIAIKKIAAKGLEGLIGFQLADAEALPFRDNTFDAATVAFGVRNFEDPKKGLREIGRVIKPGGHLVVLEFTIPSKGLFKYLYRFYFRFILPLVGRLVSRDSSAYTYLPDSVTKFPGGEKFTALLKECNYVDAEYTSLTYGIVGLYLARKA